MLKSTPESKDWTNTRNTDKDAKAVDWDYAPPNRKILVAEIASIRNATLLNEKFLIAEGCDVKQRKNGTERIQVECFWYGKRPKTMWMQIKIEPGRYIIKNSDEEKVVINIAREKKK